MDMPLGSWGQMVKDSCAGHGGKKNMNQKNPKSYKSENTPKDQVKMKIRTLTGSNGEWVEENGDKGV